MTTLQILSLLLFLTVLGLVIAVERRRYTDRRDRRHWLDGPFAELQILSCELEPVGGPEPGWRCTVRYADIYATHTLALTAPTLRQVKRTTAYRLRVIDEQTTHRVARNIALGHAARAEVRR